MSEFDTSNLEIEFAGSFYDRAFATVEITDRDGRRVLAPSVFLLGDTKKVEVPNGTYLVRAQLPSGETVSSNVKVPLERKVRLNPANDSPREFLAWAYYLGQPGLEMTSEPLRDEDVAFWVRLGAEWSTHPVRLELGGHDIGHGLLRMWVREVDRTGGDGFLAAFELALYSSAAQAPHVWLRVRDKLCAVPLSQPTRILISIKDDDLIVTVGNSNGFAQSLLGYLDDGDFVSARTIGLSTVEMTKDLEIARETLDDKLNNPTAAAIAGYYLVRIAGNALFIGEQGQEWRRWISNLASWFEWLPDGAVIAGYAALRAGNVSAATEYLLMASRRGLPFYSVGLRLLVDSLRLVSKADTKNAADLRDALEWASNALRSSARATQTTMLRCDHGAGQLLVAWKPRPVPVPVIADSENITAVTAKRSPTADDIRARNSLKVLAAAFTAVLIAFVTTLYFRLSHFAGGTDEHPDDADHDAGQQP